MSRKCQCGCRQPATGGNGVSAWASLDCAVKIAQERQRKADERRAKAERAEFRKRREELQPIQHWLKRAEKAVHSFIRKRDEGRGCISCGTHSASAYHAGHFVPVGRSASVRFDYANINLQCAQCNVFKGGNLTEYEIRLTVKIGAAEVDRLKCAPRDHKWTREELHTIESKAKADLRALLAQEKAA